MLHVVCDVCRRRYQVDEARLGTTLTCKSCHVPFEVCRENFIDPDEPEPSPDDPPPDASPSEWRQVWICIVNGVGAMGIVAALAAMLLLFFRDPRDMGGPGAASASTTVAQSPEVVSPARHQSPPVGSGESPSIDPESPVEEVEDEPGEPLPEFTISDIDPPRVQPGRTFRVLGTGLSGVERVVLVPTDAPMLAAKSLAGFEVVAEGELRVQIGQHPGDYVLVLERADATLVTVPADAQVVALDDQVVAPDELSPEATAPGFVVVRDGGRLEAGDGMCCLVERGGELICPFSPQWAGWFAQGAVVSGNLIPPVTWITPETEVRVVAPRGGVGVTTPRIIAANVEALVAADPSAPETAEFAGPPPGIRE